MSGAPKWVTWPFDFSKPKAPKPPPPVIPSPMATSSNDMDTQDAAVQTVKKKSGYSKTILTGALTPQSSGKKKRLG